MGLIDEAGSLGKQMFATSVETLDSMERKGYFAFARGGLYIIDRMLSEFSEEDVRALGDNIVTILKTVRNMTQPDVLALVNNAVDVIREEEPGNGKVSTAQRARSIWPTRR